MTTEIFLVMGWGRWGREYILDWEFFKPPRKIINNLMLILYVTIR